MKPTYHKLKEAPVRMSAYMASTFTSLLNIRRRIGLAKGDPIPFILYSYRKGACHMNIERSTDGQKNTYFGWYTFEICF